MRRLAGWGLAAAALLGAGAALADGAAPRLVPVQYAPGPSGGGDAGRGDPPGTAGPTDASATYHGFRIEITNAGGVNPKRMLAAAEHQIDIVDRSGVSPSMLAVFRRVPIRVSGTFFKGGHYGGGAFVDLSPMSSSDDRPVLLHEYMHVLEYDTFPDRFRNPDVQQFFDEAQAQNLYPSQSYMMSAPWEFFAMTASCYLNGTLAREPFTRDEIRERQPDLYAYLERLFGPRG